MAHAIWVGWVSCEIGFRYFAIRVGDEAMNIDDWPTIARKRTKPKKKRNLNRNQSVVARVEPVAHLCRSVITVICAAKVCTGAVFSLVYCIISILFFHSVS